MAATREIDVKSDSSLGDDEPDEKSSIKILDSPDPSTVFTEPPDVKNWFSSYAYESPVLGTSDQFEDSLHLEMEPEKFVVEDSDLETEEKLTIIRKVRSGDEKVDEEKEHYNFTRHNSSIEVREQKQVCKRIDRIGGKRSSSSQNKIHSDKTFKDILEGKAQQSNVTSPSKDIRELSFDDEGSISKLELKLSQKLVLCHGISMEFQAVRRINLKQTRSIRLTSKRSSWKKLVLYHLRVTLSWLKIVELRLGNKLIGGMTRKIIKKELQKMVLLQQGKMGVQEQQMQIL
ncbi:uncharacterized protein LOC18047100 [Citrus clementina]|nr:uncharacterized protein LOC18047100 [Citrus x clementina]